MSKKFVVTQKDWDIAVANYRVQGSGFQRIHSCPVAVAAQRHFSTQQVTMSGSLQVGDETYAVSDNVFDVMVAFDRLYPLVGEKERPAPKPSFPVFGTVEPDTYEYYDDYDYDDEEYGDI